MLGLLILSTEWFLPSAMSHSRDTSFPTEEAALYRDAQDHLSADIVLIAVPGTPSLSIEWLLPPAMSQSCVTSPWVLQMGTRAHAVVSQSTH